MQPALLVVVNGSIVDQNGTRAPADGSERQYYFRRRNLKAGDIIRQGSKIVQETATTSGEVNGFHRLSILNNRFYNKSIFISMVVMVIKTLPPVINY